MQPRDDTPAWAAHLPEGIEVSEIDLIAGRSLPSVWVGQWREHPDRPVLRDPDGTWFTGADLETASAAIAGRLQAAGAQRGDRLLLSGRSSVALVIAYCAALRAGLVVVPMNTAYQAREIGHVVNDATPRFAVADTDTVVMALRDADPDLRVVSPNVDLPDAEPVGLDTSQPADPALICYTSGTTGAPKGAVLSHGNVLASAAAVTIAWRWTPTDRLILCLPLFHMHGLGVGLHGTLFAGASAVLLDGFELSTVLSSAADESLGATMFFGVPTMYSRFAAAPDPTPLGRLRLCVSGSAPLPAELHDRLRSRTGLTVLERYGMTETVMLVSNPYDGDRRSGTVGLPLPGVEVRLGEHDEIEVRGPNVFRGYWKREDDTAVAFREGGWFRTGDVGQFDPDGYLRIVGRTKELIISGGFNVYPREVEDVLRGWPGVHDVAVVGTPSAEWGEVVTAYVEASGTIDTAAMLSMAALELAPFKRPRIVHVVDTLPRNSLGKVVRGALGQPGVSDV